MKREGEEEREGVERERVDTRVKKRRLLMAPSRVVLGRVGVEGNNRACG